MTRLTFLGTGNYLAPGRYWSSFVMDGTVLVEPAPIALPHLRRSSVEAADLDVVVISHFHADHTFGWPFLLLELARSGRRAPVHVVGPPGVQSHLDAMLRLGGVPNVRDAARRALDVRHVEVDGSWQEAGPLRFRAVEVEHVDHLRCFGFLFDRDGTTVGYSGDTRPCRGLDELAGDSDLLVVECNGPHPAPPVPVTHMDVADIRALRERFPRLPLVATHLGADVSLDHIEAVTVPADLETITFAPLDPPAG